MTAGRMACVSGGRASRPQPGWVLQISSSETRSRGAQAVPCTAPLWSWAGFPGWERGTCPFSQGCWPGRVSPGYAHVAGVSTELMRGTKEKRVARKNTTVYIHYPSFFRQRQKDFVSFLMGTRSLVNQAGGVSGDKHLYWLPAVG